MSRRELRIKLKKEAKETFRKNKPYIIMVNLIVVIIYLIPIVLSNIFSISFKLKLFLNIITVIIGTPLLVGLKNICLESLRGRKVNFKKVLLGFNILYKVYGTIFVQLFITFILTISFILIPIFFIKDINLRINLIKLIINILNLIFYIILFQVKYIIVDKKDISIIDSMKKSIIIIKKYIWDFILLIISFIGYGFLIFLTLGIAYIWIGPYIELTFANFYLYIKEDKLDIYKIYENKDIKWSVILGLVVYMIIESNIYQSILTPIAIKSIVNENNLKLVNFNEDKNYYLSEEEGLKYRIERNYNNLSDLIKYTVVVKNHPLDRKNNYDIKSTIIYIIADNNKVLAISCEPNDKNINIKNYNPIPGRFNIKGQIIK